MRFLKRDLKNLRNLPSCLKNLPIGFGIAREGAAIIHGHITQPTWSAELTNLYKGDLLGDDQFFSDLPQQSSSTMFIGPLRLILKPNLFEEYKFLLVLGPDGKPHVILIYLSGILLKGLYSIFDTAGQKSDPLESCMAYLFELLFKGWDLVSSGSPIIILPSTNYEVQPLFSIIYAKACVLLINIGS